MRSIFRDRDIPSSLFWALVGVLFCIGGLHYGIRRSGIPGPGFLPFVTGLILVALSLILLISSLLRRSDRANPAESLWSDGQALKRALQAIAALCFYVLAIERLGFVPTTFLFMVLILRIEPRRWTFVVLAAIGTTFFFFVLFKVLLRVPLPPGILCD
jgi:putative tricarboxylic transport membrane protein